MKQILKKYIICIICVSIILSGNIRFTTDANAAANRELKMVWFDVGAGDSMFIMLPNKKTVLIDAGIKSEGCMHIPRNLRIRSKGTERYSA